MDHLATLSLYHPTNCRVVSDCWIGKHVVRGCCDLMWVTILQFEPSNARDFIKSQYYSTPAAARCGLHWPNISEHTVVHNSCLTFAAYICQNLLNMWCNVHWGAHWKQQLEQSVFWDPRWGVFGHYMQKNLSNSLAQLCAPCWCASEARNKLELVCCNTDTVIKLCAFVGSNCNIEL